MRDLGEQGRPKKGSIRWVKRIRDPRELRLERTVDCWKIIDLAGSSPQARRDPVMERILALSSDVES